MFARYILGGTFKCVIYALCAPPKYYPLNRHYESKKESPILSLYPLLYRSKIIRMERLMKIVQFREVFFFPRRGVNFSYYYYLRTKFNALSCVCVLVCVIIWKNIVSHEPGCHYLPHNPIQPRGEWANRYTVNKLMYRHTIVIYRIGCNNI